MASITPSPLSRAAIADYAERVAEKHHIFVNGESADIESLVDSLGGTIEVSESFVSPEALTVRDRRDFTVHLPALTSHRRDRFTIAHEIGHYFLHYLQPKVTGPKDFGRGSRNTAETQANYFAGALLMPEKRFREAWEKCGGDSWSVADLFGVSKSAASVRAQTLRLR
ncbi:ImmA/IrrE family metallo-endopeptidase [Mycetocola tolaasinivorans]|uniref:ImmA/IrrE family metallo-endopeptidase n=1 Tax=Mycetocola tolaasinivorans TaxID=76635 RepID=UPI001C7DC952|nr:ImmA/IrrE family metallo-endopeptidase [Mycetocola tolaasinivorans]